MWFKPYACPNSCVATIRKAVVLLPMPPGDGEFYVIVVLLLVCSPLEQEKDVTAS